MPVQPMKTIAAVALSGSPLTVPQIVAAGMFVSGAVLLLGLTRMMSLVQRWASCGLVFLCLVFHLCNVSGTYYCQGSH